MLAVSVPPTLIALVLAGELVAANYHASTPLSRRTAKHRRRGGKDCDSAVGADPSAPPIVAAVMAGSGSGGGSGEPQNSPNVVYVDMTSTVTTKIHASSSASAAASAAPAGGDPAIVGAVLESSGDQAGGQGGSNNVVVVDIFSTVLETVYAGNAGPTAAPTVTRTQNRIPEVAAVAIKTDSQGQSSIIWDTETNPGVQQTSMPEPTGELHQGYDWDGQWRWIQAHNEVRRAFGVPDLAFRADLAKLAQTNAGYCNKEHTKAAENLQWGSGFGTPEAAVEGWASEESLYSWASPGYAESTGHFTQLIWNETRHVGCWIAKCAPGTVVDGKYDTSFQAACEYDPAGNFVGEEPFRANVPTRKSGKVPPPPSF